MTRCQGLNIPGRDLSGTPHIQLKFRIESCSSTTVCTDSSQFSGAHGQCGQCLPQISSCLHYAVQSTASPIFNKHFSYSCVWHLGCQHVIWVHFHQAACIGDANVQQEVVYVFPKTSSDFSAVIQRHIGLFSLRSAQACPLEISS